MPPKHRRGLGPGASTPRQPGGQRSSGGRDRGGEEKGKASVFVARLLSAAGAAELSFAGGKMSVAGLGR